MTFDLNQLILNAATIDELLSSSFQPGTGQKDGTDHAALRLAAWSRAASSGNWTLFAKRLARDDLTIEHVLSRFSEVRLSPEAQKPEWFVDAQWIYDALLSNVENSVSFIKTPPSPLAFESLFYALIMSAEKKMIGGVSETALELFTSSARIDLRHGLLKLLSELYAPVLYSKLVALLKSLSADQKLLASDENTNTDHFDHFIQEIRQTGFCAIFAEKPVLLRITAVIVRQWINTTQELITRLHRDKDVIRSKITQSDANTLVQGVSGDLSDPHNFGHSVLIINFDDQTKLVYKPKDLRLDVAWHDLIKDFNVSGAPVDLKPVRTIAGEEYGWTEFIEHNSCESTKDFELFYRRSGAWLAIFHLFSSSDMHFENIIADGAHPVPIDLEMILQASNPEHEQITPETAASIQSAQTVVNSVLMVGMLPSYAKSPNNKVFDAGGLNAVKSSMPSGGWKNINTNGMRWMQTITESKDFPNIAHISGQYAQLGDYLPAFIEGFVQYSHFLLQQHEAKGANRLLENFKDMPVRKVIRNTRFYYMLLQRLRDHRTMTDGVIWSAQAEFLSRLADWDVEQDILWPLQSAERLALVSLNIPHFVSISNKDLVRDITGCQIATKATTGIDRATNRFKTWNAAEIQWQAEIIKLSTSFVTGSEQKKSSESKYLFNRKFKPATLLQITPQLLSEQATQIASTIEQYAIIKDHSAAWIGLDWLGDTEVGQLITLGSDLYNGSSGIALFLAAYANYSGVRSYRELALKAIASTRHQIHQPTAARWSRAMGIGAASGLGSVIYTLTVMSELLDEPSLLQDAVATAELMTQELISADKALDVIGGSAGAILALLALHRKTQSEDVLNKAIACGVHLLRSPRSGEPEQRSWIGLGGGNQPLTGFSHGSAGFAYALSSLASASHRNDFAQAAQECLNFEYDKFDPQQSNWPDLRDPEGSKHWLNQWCHGASGIGIARIASIKLSGEKSDAFITDIHNAVKNATSNWPNHVDTLCCGTIGTIEFLAEAGELLGQTSLNELSDKRLAQIIQNKIEQGDYLWNAGNTAFNLGLFRGLSGVGYTIMRKLDPKLPNVLMWE